MRLLVVWLTLALACAACGDEGDPVDPTPNGGGEVSFAEDVQGIFDVNCVECHGENGNGGLDLRSPQSRSNLVGVPATGYDALRVTVGQPDASVLYVKIFSDGVFGDRMPLGGPYLSPEKIELVHDWIAQGALPD